MSIARIRILAIAVALAGSGVAMSLLQARTSDWKVGDVFVAIGKGKYEVRSSTGALKETIDTGTNKENAGCWFDSQFNLYTADIYNTKVLKRNLASPAHTQSVFANTLLQAPDGHSKSIVMAVNGAVYVGNAGNDNGSGTQNILHYRSDGFFLGSFAPDTEGNGGIDWMDLASDQRTMFYTSRGRLIKKFDVGTALDPVPGNPQLPNFADLTSTTPTGQAFAIRLLPPFDKNASGGLLVADNVNIKRLSSSGAVIATWDIDLQGNNNDENAWQSLNLDPDGVHFWALGTSTGRLFRFSLNTPGTNPQGTTLGPFPTAGNGTSAGVCILGEPQTQVVPLNLSTPAGPSQFFDVTAKFGNPDATGENDFYSFNLYRLRINVKGNQSVVGAVSFTPESTSSVCTSVPGPDLTPFDCRFTQTPAVCVPYFKDPNPANPLGSLDPYRCGFYRLEIPSCSAASPGSCPYADPFIKNPNGTDTDDINFEFVIDHTNPPSTVFNFGQYGSADKGNPRVMRDPSRVTGDQFFIDATAAVIDPPYIGGGGVNDYAVVQRNATVPGACATIISPNPGTTINSGASVKFTIEVKTGPMVGTVCNGTPLGGATDAPYKITLAVAGTGTNTTLKLYCTTPGNSNACFQPNGPTGTYQANVNIDQTAVPADPVNAYFFAVTSVNVPSDVQANQQPGLFAPTGRAYFVCPSGAPCGS